MIAIPYLFIAIILIVIWSIYRVLVLKKKQEKNIKREVIINTFFIYFLILISLTICKSGMLQISFENRYYVNLIPLVETVKMFQNNFMGIGNAFYNVIGNILLFVPLGFFISLLFKNKNKITLITMYGFIASLTIETLQLFTAINLSDIDDIIFNTLGAVLGWILFNLFNKLIRNNKIGDLISNISSEFNGNLLLLIYKPISIMVVSVSIFTAICIYNLTLPGNISDEQIAKEVFQYSSNAEFEATKLAFGDKLFLKDEGNYVQLMCVENVLNNRWYNGRLSIGQYEKSSGDYNVAVINNNDLLSVVAFGKNKMANIIEITLNGKSYSEELNDDEYFLVVFPELQSIRDGNDIFDIFEGKESSDLNIKFYEDEGKEYKDMKFAK